jgi:hypothetical protein
LRISSHHRDIDKARYPDIGMRGQVVREKLHGRTAQGTWVQMEKTPAAFGKRELPSVNDTRHLMDYVLYRLTRSNVGPWGLSQLTERRPMYLSPDLAVPVSLSPPVAESLALSLRRISAAGRGLFGSSKVWVTESPVRTTAANLVQLREQPNPAAWWAGAGRCVRRRPGPVRRNRARSGSGTETG